MKLLTMTISVILVSAIAFTPLIQAIPSIATPSPVLKGGPGTFNDLLMVCERNMPAIFTHKVFASFEVCWVNHI